MTEARSTASSDLDLRSTAELVALMNREDATRRRRGRRLPRGRRRSRRRDRRAAAPRRPARLRRRRLVRPPRGGRRVRVRGDVLDASGPGRRAWSPAATRRRRSSARRPRTTPRPERARVAAARRGRRRRRDRDQRRAGGTPYALGAARAAATAGAFTACVVCAPDSELAEACDRDDRRGRRAGGARRLDAAQGRDGAEARPEHALDRVDDPPRQDLRRPDGRRRACERQAARARAPDRRRGNGRCARRPWTPRSPTSDGDAKVAIVSILDRASTRTTRGRDSPPRAATCDRRSSGEARRRRRARRRAARPGRDRDRRRPHRALRPERFERHRRGIAVPGFVDLQVNGFAGVDFLEADADGYRAAGEALLETGVTSFLPTLITARGRGTARRARGGAALAPTGRAILGVHLEGPFLAASRLGTHPPAGQARPRRRAARSGCSRQARCG